MEIVFFICILVVIIVIQWIVYDKRMMVLKKKMKITFLSLLALKFIKLMLKMVYLTISLIMEKVMFGLVLA